MHTFTFTHTHTKIVLFLYHILIHCKISSFFVISLIKLTHTYTQKSKKTKCGGIAQLEERALCKREAPGSKPGTSTIQNKNIYICVLD